MILNYLEGNNLDYVNQLRDREESAREAGILQGPSLFGYHDQPRSHAMGRTGILRDEAMDAITGKMDAMGFGDTLATGFGATMNTSIGQATAGFGMAGGGFGMSGMSLGETGRGSFGFGETLSSIREGETIRHTHDITVVEGSQGDGGKSFGSFGETTTGYGNTFGETTGYGNTGLSSWHAAGADTNRSGLSSSSEEGYLLSLTLTLTLTLTLILLWRRAICATPT